MGPWKGIRIGGTKEPIELYNPADDIGEHNDIADEHPEIVKRIAEIMIKAREGSEFNDFWPLPERRVDGVDVEVADVVAAERDVIHPDEPLQAALKGGSL